jgi:hypothetical protein
VIDKNANYPQVAIPGFTIFYHRGEGGFHGGIWEILYYISQRTKQNPSVRRVFYKNIITDN